MRLTEEEYDILKMLRRLADRSGFEYGIAAQLRERTTGEILWKSEAFTSCDRNRVRIPPPVLDRESVSLYHAHTNNTIFSVRDLKLLLRPNVDKISVIAVSSNTAVVLTGSGYRPDEEEFLQVTGEIQRAVPYELANDPDFYEWTQEERVSRLFHEQAFQIARYFKWTLEGGAI